MSTTSSKAIVVEDLCKRYRINHTDGGNKGGYRTLRESLMKALASPIRNLRSGAALGEVEDFWALRDINFTVADGEVVGIIGRNGAGKSTLLKILTRITEPTTGQARMRGRVGSLLEVGTGFHPELTGRENVFLNGSILGMGRGEIKSKFDQIVDFSGVEKFIDTPVKRYSSGMKVRLAFAVAAHLNLEILLIDEVLAVGDVEFQRRCLGKMDDVAKSGRTILFVSHNMAAVQNLCPRAVLLQAGRIVAAGDSESVVTQYLQSFETASGSRDLRHVTDGRWGSGEARLQSVEILNSSGELTTTLPMGEGMIVRVEILGICPIEALALQVAILNDQGEIYCRVNSRDIRKWTFGLRAGEHVKVDCRIPSMNLGPNPHSLHLQLLGPSGPVDTIEYAVSFEVVPADVFKSGRMLHGHNMIFFDADWDLKTSRNGQ